jgi:hypothetical protein
MSKNKSEFKILITGISIISALGLGISIASKDLLKAKNETSAGPDSKPLNLGESTLGLPPLPTLATYQSASPAYEPRVISAQSDQPLELRQVEAPTQPAAPPRIQNPVVDEVIIGGNQPVNQGGGGSTDSNPPAPATTTQSS